MQEDDADKRLIARQPVLKTAKIHVVHSIHDCLVLDLSATGARIGTELHVLFPPEVKIELRTGVIWIAQLRWQREKEAGFEFVRFAGLNDEASLEASGMLAALHHSGVGPVLGRLAAADYFSSPELRSAADAFAQAQDALDQAFQQILKRS